MAEYNFPGADYMPGTTAQDYSTLLSATPPNTMTEGWNETGLLDYTPPNVQWQAPLAQFGENIYGNYVKSYPGLLGTYNRRLSIPTGAAEALPTEGGRPQSMANYGREHYLRHGTEAGGSRRLPGEPGAPAPGVLWGDPGRNPYIGYGGGVAEGIGTGGGPLSATGEVPEGMELAYPVWSYWAGSGREKDVDEFYQPGKYGGDNFDYYTQDTSIPYFQYAPGDPRSFYQGNQQIRVGQAYIPIGDYPEEGAFRFSQLSPGTWLR